MPSCNSRRINYIPWSDAQVWRDTQLLVLQSQRQARASSSAHARFSPRYVLPLALLYIYGYFIRYLLSTLHSPLTT